MLATWQLTSAIPGVVRAPPSNIKHTKIRPAPHRLAFLPVRRARCVLSGACPGNSGCWCVRDVCVRVVGGAAA